MGKLLGKPQRAYACRRSDSIKRDTIESHDSSSARQITLEALHNHHLAAVCLSLRDQRPRGQDLRAAEEHGHFVQ